MADWYDFARATAESYPGGGDRFFATETRDPRVAFPRSVVVGGVSDARPEKRGVLLVALTSDGERQELGVPSREAGLAVLRALRDAWPDLAGAS